MNEEVGGGAVDGKRLSAAKQTFGTGSWLEPVPKVFWYRLVIPTGTKGLSGVPVRGWNRYQRSLWAAKFAREAQHTFGTGWCYQPVPKDFSIFFFCFLFLSIPLVPVGVTNRYQKDFSIFFFCFLFLFSFIYFVFFYLMLFQLFFLVSFFLLFSYILLFIYFYLNAFSIF